MAAVCDALYAKLLAEGRVKAKPSKKPTTRAGSCTAADAGWPGAAVPSLSV